MEKLTNYEFTSKPRGGKSKYPWEEIFDGGIYKLVDGADFNVDLPEGKEPISVDSFAGQVRSAANSDKYRKSLKVEKGDNYVIVQVTGDLGDRVSRPRKPKADAGGGTASGAASNGAQTPSVPTPAAPAPAAPKGAAPAAPRPAAPASASAGK